MNTGGINIDKQLFKDCRNWFINRNANPMYKFTDIEGVQLKNILKRLITGISKKYGDLTPQKLNEMVSSAFQDTVEFADKHGYSLTCMNLITKFNNVMEHIRNERTGKHSKGFNPNENTWVNTLKATDIHTGTNELFDKGVRQISECKTRSDS